MKNRKPRKPRKVVMDKVLNLPQLRNVELEQKWEDAQKQCDNMLQLILTYGSSAN